MAFFIKIFGLAGSEGMCIHTTSSKYWIWYFISMCLHVNEALHLGYQFLLLF